MKILVVGDGGRESAIVKKISDSPSITELYIAPGNGGTSKYATNINVKSNDIESLLNFAINNNIDLTIVGPEIPLSMGIVDLFEKNNLNIFGPNKKASKIESSKIFAKNLMKKYKIPTADFNVFNDSKNAIKYLKTSKFPIVIKADGLAGGKGVLIVNNFKEAEIAVENIMNKKIFGQSGEKIIIEEFLKGKEFSVFVFTDGNKILHMLSACDYKKAFDNDEGPNTGGMGSFAPAPQFNKSNEEYIVKKIIDPTLKGLNEKQHTFKGVLYCGLIETHKGIFVIEYNCRLGDPETQVVLPTLDYDLLTLIQSCIKSKPIINIPKQKIIAVGVVLVSDGYPGKYETGKKIDIDENFNKIDNSYLYHAGTKFENEQLITSGGRVLTAVGVGENINEARKIAYQITNTVKYKNKFMRTDIALNYEEKK
ncbi:MAG: phosphoribosylamine--glycine ligase [SAR202 cluster bacterium]|nr:phosphoribosylamine--glycine ligase [SAR202 cluster bacterium]